VLFRSVVVWIFQPPPFACSILMIRSKGFFREHALLHCVGCVRRLVFNLIETDQIKLSGCAIVLDLSTGGTITRVYAYGKVKSVGFRKAPMTPMVESGASCALAHLFWRPARQITIPIGISFLLVARVVFLGCSCHRNFF